MYFKIQKQITKFHKEEEEYNKTVLLNYIKNNVQQKDIFGPTYFKEELNIQDLGGLINDLFKQKYIETDKDERVVLRQKAETLLEKNSDLIEFFNLANVYTDISEYQEAKITRGKDKSFQNIMISLLLKKVELAKQNDNYMAVKNMHSDIAELYEQTEYKPQALYHYLTAMYYEVSGLEYYDKFLEYISGECDAKELKACYDYAYIAPNLIKGVSRLKESYIEEMVDKIYMKNAININLCRIDKFKELVNSIVINKFENRLWQIYFWQAFKGLIISADRYKIDKCKVNNKI